MSDLGLYEIAGALREKNKIEKEKLEFDKSYYEQNKQIEKESIKAMQKMTEVVSQYASSMNVINENFKTVHRGIVALYGEIQELKTKIESV